VYTLLCYRSIFFADVPCLDNGGCVSVDVKTGMGLVIPANVFHLVETVVDTAAFGCNFVDGAHLPVAVDAVREEQDLGLDGTFPRFDVLGVLLAHYSMTGKLDVPLRSHDTETLLAMWPLLRATQGLLDRLQEFVSTYYIATIYLNLQNKIHQLKDFLT
jgi:hypothetical protein